MRKGVITTDDVDQQIHAALSEYALPITKFDQGIDLYRTQPTGRGEDSRFYNCSSNSRYGDRNGKVGVCYVAGSGEAAVAETLQHGKLGPGNPVLQSEIEGMSLHKLTAARTLNLVDVGILAANSGYKLDEIVLSKGQRAKGYTLTQALSAACMKIADVDGIIFPSRVYHRARGFEGYNLALFEGRETQLKLDSNCPLIEVVFSTGEVISDIMLRLKVPLE